MAKIKVPSYGWNVVGANPLNSIPENVGEITAARLNLLTLSRAFDHDLRDKSKPYQQQKAIRNLLEGWVEENRSCRAFQTHMKRKWLEDDTISYRLRPPSPHQRFCHVTSDENPTIVLDREGKVLVYKFRIPQQLLVNLADSDLCLASTKRVNYSLWANSTQPSTELMVTRDYKKNLPQSAGFFKDNKELLSLLSDKLRLLDPEMAYEYAKVDRFLRYDQKRLAGAWHGAHINRRTEERSGEEVKPKKSWKDWGHGLSVMIPWGDFDGGDLTLYNLGMRFEMKPGDAILFNAKAISYAVGQVTKGTRNQLDLVVHGQTMKWLKGKVATTPIARAAAQVAANVAARAQQESIMRETEKSPEQKKEENKNERKKELAAIAKENARINTPTTGAMRSPEYAAQPGRKRKAIDLLRQRALEASNANLQPLGNRNIISTAEPLPQQPPAQDPVADFKPSDVTRAEPHPERQPEILQPSESQPDNTPMVLDTSNISLSGCEHQEPQREYLLIPEQNPFYVDFDESPEPQPSIGFNYDDSRITEISGGLLVPVSRGPSTNAALVLPDHMIWEAALREEERLAKRKHAEDQRR